MYIFTYRCNLQTAFRLIW